jgi:hypothetical protein
VLQNTKVHIRVCRVSGLVTRVTRWVLLMEQELLTLPEHLSSPLVFSGVHSSCYSVCTVKPVLGGHNTCTKCITWKCLAINLMTTLVRFYWTSFNRSPLLRGHFWHSPWVAQCGSIKIWSVPVHFNEFWMANLHIWTY